MLRLTGDSPVTEDTQSGAFIIRPFSFLQLDIFPGYLLDYDCISRCVVRVRHTSWTPFPRLILSFPASLNIATSKPQQNWSGACGKRRKGRKSVRIFSRTYGFGTPLRGSVQRLRTRVPGLCLIGSPSKDCTDKYVWGFLEGIGLHVTKCRWPITSGV